MIKFGDSSAITYYITNILNTQYIPTIPVVSSKPNNPAEIKTGYILNKYLIDSKGNTVEDYVFGKKYMNISQIFSYNPGYYSTELHEYLGKYLRAYSNFYKIDLMNFYNCFSNRFINNFSLPITLENNRFNIPDYNPSNIITCFPVKYDIPYSIKFYSNAVANIKIQPILFNGDNLLTNIKIFNCNRYTINKNSTLNLMVSNEEGKGDFTSTFLGGNEESISYNKYLYLAIEFENLGDIPQLVALEQPQYTNAINNTLLDLKVDYNVPFSDRLLEYLTGNVITPVDDIKQNIRRLQLIVDSSDFYNKFIKPYSSNNDSQTPKFSKIKGYYSEELRNYLYNTLYRYCNDYNTKYPNLDPIILNDYLGYIDKDVEELLLSCVGPTLKNLLLEV